MRARSREFIEELLRGELEAAVCTENLFRVDDVTESPKLVE